MTAKKILTQGIVQGVGFRPYVYRLATSLNLNGYVRNLGNVVEIILEGDNIELFIKRLQNELPPIARIDSFKVLDIDESNFDEFKIIESSDSYSGISVIPPDIAICDSCLAEIRNPTDRRYILLMPVLIVDPDLLLLIPSHMIEIKLQWTNFHYVMTV